jgi:hypothetical protein
MKGPRVEQSYKTYDSHVWFLFMTRTQHFKGEKVFGSTKRLTNFLLGAESDYYKLYYVNFSHPWVAIPPPQTKIVEDFDVHRHWFVRTMTTNSLSMWVEGDKDCVCGWPMAYWSLPTHFYCSMFHFAKTYMNQVLHKNQYIQNDKWESCSSLL